MFKKQSVITILTICYLVCCGAVRASDSEPVALWKMVTPDSRGMVIPKAAGHKDINATAEVSYQRSFLQNLVQGNQYSIQTPQGTHGLNLVKVERIAQTQTLTFQSTDNPNLPQGKLYISEQGVSAWLPTPSGIWRVSNNQLQREMRWASAESDMKTRPGDNLNTIVELLSGTAEKQSKASISNDTAMSPVILKVLFVTSPELELAQLSVDDYIAQMVDINNTILQASGTNVTLQLAGTVSADLESYSADQILDNLAKSNAQDSTYGDIDNEILEPIWQARLETGADIVSVYLSTLPNGLCGKSWLNGDAQQVFDYQYAVNVVAASTLFSSGTSQLCSSDTLGHEIGHNLGLAHSAEQDGEGTVFTWGRGYGVQDSFSTVMAYPQSFGDAIAVPFFSSPSLTCLNEVACGEFGEGDSGADAVAAINAVATRVAQIHNESVTLPAQEAIDSLDVELVSCLADKNENWVSSEEINQINCPSADVASLEGVQHFPRLSFISVNHTLDTSLHVFRRLNEVIALDFRYSEISDLSPIVHLKDNLVFLQFFTNNLSCQDKTVLESWGIAQLLLHGDCLSQDNDAADFDDDGHSNLLDIDDDNDGIDDIADALPFDASNADDSDADGVPDAQDAFPFDGSESADSDNDTIGDNQDTDRDNDGVINELDCAPLDITKHSECQAQVSFVPHDYDGDGKADVAVRRSSNAFQYILNSGNNEIQRIELGKNPHDIAISGDFDGDGIADIGVRRAANKMWYVRPSSGGELLRVEFGLQEEDIPVPADFDGDGITDFAVRRPSTQQWFVRNSSNAEIQRYNFGLQAEDVPVPADYDGDGKADIAVRRPSNKFWYILSSLDGSILRYQFGMQDEDIPVPADYDGDGITDIAVRRPSEYSWYILRSSDQQIQRIEFGRNQYDIPIVADYDGDGKSDVAVRRPGTFIQYILRSSDEQIDRITFGKDAKDMPLAAPVMTRLLNDIQSENISEEIELAKIRMLSYAEAQVLAVIKP